jgi:hypothetical protein
MPPPQALRIRPVSLRSTFTHTQNYPRIAHARPQPIHHQHRTQHTDTHPTHDVARFSWVPRVLRKSTWDLVIPKFLRNRKSHNTTTTSPNTPTKQRNPATYFIWIYLLIGSQAIRIIGVQSEFKTFTRRAEIRLEKLREVLRALQAGEEVDVEKELGTGVESEEVEWEEAMREIEEEEDRWVKAKRKMVESEERRKREVEDREKEEERVRLDASPVARREEGSKIVSAVGFY